MLRNVLRVMSGLIVFAFGASLLEPRNELRTTLIFYGPTLLVVVGIHVVAQRGHLLTASWALSVFVWAQMAVVTLLFGGLKGSFTSLFIVGVTLAGSLIGGRSAAALAVATSVWAGVLWALEQSGALPTPITEYSPVNAWIALTMSLGLTAVLLRGSLESLQALHAQALAAAAERDAVLRRSIQAQKMEVVGNVASGIAHDFNNLLTVIGASTQLLRLHGPPATGGAATALDELEGATERAALMTRHLLTFGKAKTAELGAADLSASVQAFAPMLPRLLGAEITFQVDVAPGVIVVGSRAGLEQILLNLVVNARDAMPKGGQVTIRADAQGTLAVQDTGEGMDEATQAKIFDPFFTTKTTGTGLGLATVRDLVQRFGGEIAVRSVAGQGTTFEIRLKPAPPVVRPPA